MLIQNNFVSLHHNKHKTFTAMVVIWKYEQKEEQRKEFSDIKSAFRFQASLLKKKKGLEYAKYG